MHHKRITHTHILKIADQWSPKGHGGKLLLKS